MDPVERRERIALWIAENPEKLSHVFIQDCEFPMGIDVTRESCALCGGFFAPHGEVSLFYWSGEGSNPNDGSPNYVHPGCRLEARNWAHLPADEPFVAWRPVLVK